MTADLHAASLSRILDVSGARDELSLRTVFEATLAARGIESDDWETGRTWWLIDDRYAYTEIVQATLRGSGAASRLELILPAPCDPEAWQTAPESVRVAGHDGCYVGAPLVAQAQLVARPGLRATVRPTASRLDTEDASADRTLILKPDLGRGLRVRSGPLPDRLRERWDATFRQLAEGAAATAAGYVTPATREAIIAACPNGDREEALASPIDRVADQPYGPAHAGIRYVGDLLLQHLFLALSRTLDRQLPSLRRSGSHAFIGPVLSDQLAASVQRFVRRSGFLLSDDASNTLARAERRRAITWFGRFGLSTPARGSLDLRDLHPGWRGTICPIHTPESERIGLIRYAALGEAAPDGWADVSLSAALIPFLNHDDQARAVLAAKNLKQAVPLDHPEPPLVRTGVERLAAETAPHAAQGPPPDVVIDQDGYPQLALGLNLLAAMTPWHGLNFEDAIVLSRSAAERLVHTGRERWSENVGLGAWVVRSAEAGDHVERGHPIAQVHPADRASFPVLAADTGVLDELTFDPDDGRLHWTMIINRPLEPGDKLTNRHGGKGVVSRILPDAEMPRVPALDRPVEVLLNPLGAIRRLNIGQLHEMAVGLRSLLTDGRPVIAGRRLDDRAGLAAELRRLGAADGRMALAWADGSPAFDGNPILVGPQYLIKLSHTARSKLSVRGDGARARWRQQPTSQTRIRGGRRIGAAQRLGEMELWGLMAVGAAVTVRAVTGGHEPGPRPTWEAVEAHLGAAALSVADDGSIEPAPTDLLSGLRLYSSDELRAIRRTLMAGSTADDPAAHPLYDRSHGNGEARRRLARGFDLAHLPVADRTGSLELRHPWTDGLLTVLPVLPPAYRTFGADDLDQLYLDLARCLAPPIPASTAGRANKADGWRGTPAEVAQLRRLITRLFGAPTSSRPSGLAGRLDGRNGLLRRYLLGVSQDRSGRAVITPDPELPIEEIGLPEPLYDELIGADDDRTVLINRAPTLTPASLVAVTARRTPGVALRLHPSLLGPLAGDFDGDTAAIFRLPDAAVRAECRELLRPRTRLRRLGDGGLQGKADLDLALGLCRVDPGHRGDAEAWLARRIDEHPDDPMAALAAGQRVLWSYATGWSLGLLDQPRLRGPLTEAALSAELAELLRSGAVKAAALEQLAITKTAAASGNPDLPTSAPTTCILDGLSDDDFFDGARAGLARLAEKKLLTPLAGALTKTLVEIGYEVVISAPDCGRRTPTRSPLSCRTADPCQACFGELPGTDGPPPVGMRVGVLAGMLIGERSTQLAMKTFHAGAGAGIDVTELRALLGHGRSRRLAGASGPRTVNDYLAAAADRDRAWTEIAGLIHDGLARAVAPAYVDVIVRQLAEAAADRSGEGSLAVRAEHRGRTPIIRATSRGSLRSALDPTAPHDLRERARRDLVRGATR